ncbi:hypothetical protein Q2941_47005 [Bradyrhizobium sp. UFLA05-153]
MKHLDVSKSMPAAELLSVIPPVEAVRSGESDARNKTLLAIPAFRDVPKDQTRDLRLPERNACPE